MKRFFNNNDSNWDDDDEEEFEEDHVEGLDSDEYLKAIQNDLMEVELNQRLLRDATEIARTDWLWIFRSSETKIKRIEDIFKRLVVLLNFDQGSDFDEE